MELVSYYDIFDMGIGINYVVKFIKRSDFNIFIYKLYISAFLFLIKKLSDLKDTKEKENFWGNLIISLLLIGVKVYLVYYYFTLFISYIYRFKLHGLIFPMGIAACIVPIYHIHEAGTKYFSKIKPEEEQGFILTKKIFKITMIL